MYKRVIKFLDKHNILSERQYRFRKKAFYKFSYNGTGRKDIERN